MERLCNTRSGRTPKISSVYWPCPATPPISWGGKEVNDATKSIAAKVPKTFFAVQDISNNMVMVRSMVIKIFCSLFVYQKKSLSYLMV